MAWRPTLPAKIAIGAALAAVLLLADDGAALLQRLTEAPWTFGAPDRRPVGTWQGTAPFPEAGTRTLKLELVLDELSDRDSDRRSTDQNGFFFRRIQTYRSSGPYLKGYLEIADGGRQDRYEVEGPVNRGGSQSTLNVHGADGRAGVLVEQAIARFAPPVVELTLRYRIPAEGVRKPGPVFSYVQAGIAWTAAAGPGQAALARTAP